MFMRLFNRLAILKNQSISDIQLIEEYYRIHFDFNKRYFAIGHESRQEFESNIKNGYEQLIAMKLYSNELHGSYNSLQHLLKNYKTFFSHGLDDVSIKSIIILMNEYCKNPKKLNDFASFRLKFSSFCFSGRDERMLTNDPEYYSPSQLNQLTSYFLLLNYANLTSDFNDGG